MPDAFISGVIYTELQVLKVNGLRILSAYEIRVLCGPWAKDIVELWATVIVV